MSEVAQLSVQSGDLGRVLSAAFQLGASDIHLKADAVPMYRMVGTLRPVEFPPVAASALYDLCARLTGRSKEEMQEIHQFEFSCPWEEVGRLRGHYYRQRDKPALALRTIPLVVPSLGELRLPAMLKRVCEMEHGLVLVTGPTGMGKSTTLASILSAIAQSSCRHIVTLEDPIEFLIADGVSSVAQREVGRDVATFAQGLKAALRQDPDVLVIGEIRDRETMEVALHAAVTGHLVLSAVHFSDGNSTVDGILAMCEPREQVNWRHRLAQGLQCVISQRLLPRRGSGERVLATEVLVNDPSVRSCIVDESRTRNIRTCIGRGGESQMHTMDQSLLQLLEAQLITTETAQSVAVSPGDLMRQANLRRLV